MVAFTFATGLNKGAGGWIWIKHWRQIKVERLFLFTVLEVRNRKVFGYYLTPQIIRPSTCSWSWKKWGKKDPSYLLPGCLCRSLKVSLHNRLSPRQPKTCTEPIRQIQYSMDASFLCLRMHRFMTPSEHACVNKRAMNVYRKSLSAAWNRS